MENKDGNMNLFSDFDEDMNKTDLFEEKQREEKPVTEEKKEEETIPTTFVPDEKTGYYSARAQYVPQNNGYFSKPQKPKFSVATVLVSVILSLAVGIGSAFAVLKLNKNNEQYYASDGGTVTQNSIVSTSEELGVVEAVYKTAGPSVVGIRATVNANSFFESTGDGSGVIYSSDGYIITNYHVIAGGSSTGYNGTTTYSGIASKIDVYLSGDTNTAIPAKVIGYNSSYDIAVIKINKKGLKPINIGDSKKLKVGQFVVAIGNPGGLQFMSSVTYGVIGGLDRTLQVESESVGLIQTDAAINPGNSGGALVDTKGNLIGINSSKLVDTSYEGMGFAIPVNEVVDICKKIINNESSASPYIGITISTAYDGKSLKALGFPEGAVVSSVTAGGPAEAAGLKRADIITSFNGKSISGYETFRTALSKCKPNQTVPIEVYRGGQTYQTTITIGANNQVD